MIDPFGPLLAAHLIGDFVVQTDWMAANKGRPADTFTAVDPPAVIPVGVLGPLRVGARVTVIDGPAPQEGYYEGMRGTLALVRHPAPKEVRRRSWAANQAHVLTYHAVLLPVLIALGASYPRMAIALAVSYVLHSLIDRRWPVVALMRKTGSSAFAETDLGRFWVDQTLHIVTIALMAAYVVW